MQKWTILAKLWPKTMQAYISGYNSKCFFQTLKHDWVQQIDTNH